MKCNYACGSAEHQLGRRAFLGGFAGGIAAGGTAFFTRPAAAKKLSKDQKRVLVFNMAGGMSQLESWDPKPGTPTGGPFRAIPTAVPGTHITELLPMTAKLMDQLSIVRSVNTKENDHGKGHYKIFTGRDKTPAADFPKLGAVAAKALTPESNSLPGHIVITPSGSGNRGNDSAYLGPKFSSISLNGKPPQNTSRAKDLTEASDNSRNDFRRTVNNRFLAKRRTALTDAYTYSYEQALQLMKERDVFDVSKEPAADLERYGKYDLGRHCLLARRLLENDITFVQVTHSNYDTHNENFNFHLEQMGEFDRSFSALVSDLFERGMLDSTLILVLSEFGRTPNINRYYGRDHWGTAWSVLVSGAGTQRGAVIGKTNENGTAVTDGEVNHGHLWHTYLRAVGLDSFGSFDIEGREVPMADPQFQPIEALLA